MKSILKILGLSLAMIVAVSIGLVLSLISVLADINPILIGVILFVPVVIVLILSTILISCNDD